MTNSLKNRLAQLRELEEPAKRVWVYVLSGITITFVGAVWIIYINFTLGSVPPQSTLRASLKENAIETEVAPSHPVLANFKNNVSTIKKNIASWLMGLVNKENEIIIEK